MPKPTIEGVAERSRSLLYSLASCWGTHNARDYPMIADALRERANVARLIARSLQADEASVREATVQCRITANRWRRMNVSGVPDNLRDIYEGCARQLAQRADFIDDDLNVFLLIEALERKLRELEIDEQKARQVIEWLAETRLHADKIPSPEGSGAAF